MTRRWANVAELIAAQGLKGRLVARSVRGLPFLLKEGMSVDFVPPTLHGPRHARVIFLQSAGGGDYIVGFDTVHNRDDAECIVGSYCLVSRELLPNDFEELLRLDSRHVQSYRVHDENLGMLGPIIEVREMPTQDLLVVEYNHEEIFIPFVDEFVLDIDEDSKVVHVNVPQSLLDLNASSKD